ncbi:hypothetical protein ABTE85_22715, partial [Acinetobacter baumannii]
AAEALGIGIQADGQRQAEGEGDAENTLHCSLSLLGESTRAMLRRYGRQDQPDFVSGYCSPAAVFSPAASGSRVGARVHPRCR